MARNRLTCFLPVVAAVLALVAIDAGALTLRYDTYGKLIAPDYETVRYGPYSAEITFGQTVGYRYVTTTGSGAPYLSGNNLGTILKDGSDFPLISKLTLRNYYLLGDSADIDLSFNIAYHYYPMGTSDDYWEFDLIDQGLTIGMGSFTATLRKEGWSAGYGSEAYSLYSSERGYGASASFSSEFNLTQFLKGKIYDQPSIRTEYVDARGYSDSFSGRRYQYFQNIVGLDLDWLMSKDQNLGLTLLRTDVMPFGNSSFTNQRSVVYQVAATYEQKLSDTLLAGIRANLYLRDYPDSTRGSQVQHSYEPYMQWQATDRSSIELGVGYAQATLSSAGAYETNGTVETVIGRASLKTELQKNLWHAFSFQRYLRGGFSAGLETVDAYRYSIFYSPANDFTVGFSTTLSTSEPELSTLNSYSDWATQLAITYPLSDLLTMHFSTTYSQRRNGEGDTTAQNDITVTSDYDTLSAILGLTYTLSKQTTLSTYLQHSSRMSDNPSLEYTRYVYGLTVTYRYTF